MCIRDRSLLYMKRLHFLRDVAHELRNYYDYSSSTLFPDSYINLKFCFAASEYILVFYLVSIVCGYYTDLVDFEKRVTDVLQISPDKPHFKKQIKATLQEVVENLRSIIKKGSNDWFSKDPELRDQLQNTLQQNSFSHFKALWFRLDQFIKHIVQDFKSKSMDKINKEIPYAIVNHLLDLITSNYSLFRSKKEYPYLGRHIYTFKVDQHLKNLLEKRTYPDLRNYIDTQEKAIVA
eukprot:TRINITY_DN3175_c0_g1_i1.p1 TRINITY_DN3175_c0_g1~~TRINITY_DN3175_c0_g1_i1.p1  ORF type:complete len:235 (+),score=39.63 TRINITY_DN3175_c0_g1_i1:64-768(+)